MADQTAKKPDNDGEKPLNDTELRIGATVRVGKLDTIPQIRKELARLYREVRRRHGKYPDSQTGVRLAQILGQVYTLKEKEALERLEVEMRALLAQAPKAQVYGIDSRTN